MKRVLVTGGAGFIGSHLVDRLVETGHRVVVIDNLSTGKRRNVNKKAKFYKIDIRHGSIRGIFKKEKFDYVYHFAAQKNLRTSIKNPLYDAGVNITGSLNILENCVKYKIKRFIFASTGGAIYGDAKVIPTPESYDAHPTSPYGIAKLTIDHYLHYYYVVHRLPNVSLRLANVYGPRQDPEGEAGVVAIFIDKILRNKQPIINGTGKQTRDYVYVSDVVESAILALKKNQKGYFNIGTAKETSVNELFNKIIKVSKRKVKKVHGPAIAGEQMRSCLSIVKAKKELGWKPRVQLDSGLKSTYDWFRKNLK